MPKIALATFIALAFVVIRTSSPRAQALIPPSPGIWLSAEVPHLVRGALRDRLIASLRRITGFAHLDFDNDGWLRSEEGASRGSATARHILRRATDSGDIFVVQNHSNSGLVNFGQIEALDYMNYKTSQKALVWWVRLDFADFLRIAAPQQVRASFDEGFTFFHELLHALGYRDATGEDELGECATILNQVREELGLPLRTEYFARLHGGIASIRLGFLDHRTRRVRYLRFALEARPTAGVRSTAVRR